MPPQHPVPGTRRGNIRVGYPTLAALHLVVCRDVPHVLPVLKPWQFPTHVLMTIGMVRQLTTALAQPEFRLYTGHTLFLRRPPTSEPTNRPPRLGLTTATNGRSVWKALYKENIAHRGPTALFRRILRLTFRQCLLVLANRPGSTVARHRVAQKTAPLLPLGAATLTPDRHRP